MGGLCLVNTELVSRASLPPREGVDEDVSNCKHPFWRHALISESVRL